jgi:hypothetical protein
MSKAINTNTVNTVHQALDSTFTYNEKIALLQAHYKGKTAEEIRAAILPDVASYKKYAVPMVDGKGKAVGTKVLDKEHPQYENCRKAVTNLTKAIVGTTDDNTEKVELEVPAEILAAAAKLAKLCNAYDEARKLAATAISQAFAAK